ncbi:unnamed protein product [Paramecium octaurelia]|uniref:Uncharacterized protein n=1 Tax=Paramecium octaurelia TaxID=43137 RepID=A0A8S1WI66_PAROT|nr:unnamed protein product [Paramecium octaurelia]
MYTVLKVKELYFLKSRNFLFKFKVDGKNSIHGKEIYYNQYQIESSNDWHFNWRIYEAMFNMGNSIEGKVDFYQNEDIIAHKIRYPDEYMMISLLNHNLLISFCLLLIYLYSSILNYGLFISTYQRGNQLRSFWNQI